MYEPPYPPSYHYCSFYKDDFDIKLPIKVDVPLNKETKSILSHLFIDSLKGKYLVNFTTSTVVHPILNSINNPIYQPSHSGRI